MLTIFTALFGKNGMIQYRPTIVNTDHEKSEQIGLIQTQIAVNAPQFGSETSQSSKRCFK